MLPGAQGYTSVYVLKGGLDEWKDQVVFPVVADNPTPADRARDERLRSISAFFILSSGGIVTPTSSWASFTRSAVAPANASSVNVVLQIDGAGATVHVDDVVLTSLSPAPARAR